MMLCMTYTGGGSIFYQKVNPSQTGVSRRAKLSVSIKLFTIARKQKKTPTLDWLLPRSTRTMPDVRAGLLLAGGQQESGPMAGQPGRIATKGKYIVCFKTTPLCPAIIILNQQSRAT